MSATEIRHEIDSLLDIVQEKDEFFLKSVHSLLKTYVEEIKDPILGYEMDGTPITVSAFLKQADASMEEVAKGEYITIEELDKQSKEWLIRTR